MISSPGLKEQENQPEHSLVRELTWRYLVAIALVIILSTAAWFSLHLVIAEQSSTAAIVNTSGRQRTLCMQIALLSNSLATSPSSQRPEIRAHLLDVINKMENAHHALLYGSKSMHIPARQSATVKAMYFDGPDALDLQVNKYLKVTREFLSTPDDKLDHHHPDLPYITKAADGHLLYGLNRMVNQYQLEGEQAILNLSRAETLVWLLTLMLLGAEILLIFRPMTAYARKVISRLQLLLEEQRRNEERLEEIVQLRTLELEHQAHIDFLTQVNNRRNFMSLAETELGRSRRYGTPLSLFMIDIDLFKNINDHHGHKAGDLVLQKLTEICRQTLRAVDIIGRIGGEEFAVILPETDLPGALDVAERLRAVVAAGVVSLEGQQQISVTISIGVAQLITPEENFDMLLTRADKALYLAKEGGRNRVVSAG